MFWGAVRGVISITEIVQESKIDEKLAEFKVKGIELDKKIEGFNFYAETDKLLNEQLDFVKKVDKLKAESFKLEKKKEQFELIKKVEALKKEEFDSELKVDDLKAEMLELSNKVDKLKKDESNLEKKVDKLKIELFELYTKLNALKKEEFRLKKGANKKTYEVDIESRAVGDTTDIIKQERITSVEDEVGEEAEDIKKKGKKTVKSKAKRVTRNTPSKKIALTKRIVKGVEPVGISDKAIVEAEDSVKEESISVSDDKAGREAEDSVKKADSDSEVVISKKITKKKGKKVTKKKPKDDV